MRTYSFLLLFMILPIILPAQYEGWENFVYADAIFTAAETSTDIWLSVRGKIVQIDARTEEQTFHDMALSGFESYKIEDFWVDENDQLYYLDSPNTLGYWDGDSWVKLPHLSQTSLVPLHQIAGKNGDNMILLGYDDFLYEAFPDGTASRVGGIPEDLEGFISGTFAKADGRTVLWSSQEIGIWTDAAYTPLQVTSTDHFQQAFPGQGEAIWLQGNYGLYYFADSEWTLLPYEQMSEGGLSVHNFSPGLPGQGFLTSEAGLYEIIAEDGQLRWLQLDHDLPEPVLRFRRAYVDRQQRFWYFGGGQPDLWIWEEGHAARPTSMHSWLPIPDFQSIAVDPAGRVWIGGWGGIAYLHGGRWHILDQPPSFNSSGINEILFNQLGEPILATGSMFTFDTPTGEIIQWHQQSSSWDTLDRTGSLLDGQVVTQMVQDQKGNLWMLDGSQTVLSIYSRNRWFDFLITDMPLTANFFTTFAEDVDGTMWIGTNNGLISYDGFQWKVEADSATLDLSSDNILDLDFDEKGQLWLAVGEDGVRCWDGQQWLAYRVGVELPEGSDCHQLSTSMPGEVWVTLSSQGIARFDGLDWTHFSEDNSDLYSNYINFMTSDHQGRMWVGGSGFLSTYWPGHAAVEPFRLKTDQPIAVYPNPGCCQFQVSWRNEEATNAELVIYDALGREIRRIPTGERPAGEHFIQFDRENLLPGLYYLTIAGDEKGKTAPFVVR